jgi:Cd2+/Zn2+-exporting ATPase
MLVRQSPSTLFTPRVELWAAVAAGVLLGAGFILTRVWQTPVGEWLVWTSLLIGMLFGGRAAWSALAARRFDIDVLMVVGAALAAYIGHPEEGALLLFLFVLAGALEDLAAVRTRREIESLHAMLPREALALRQGEWREVEAESLVPGERIKVRPGERVPTDARVVAGQTSLDQSAITGESVPRDVAPGDEIFAGTINVDDPVEAEVLRPVRESSLQRILSMVMRAQAQREPVQRAIDRLSQPYAYAVLALSVLVVAAWWVFLDRPLLGDTGTRGALHTGITLLIVASPCALVIATPTATLAGIARAARAGVLFKGGRAIDALARVAAVCFDKTGTLTVGRPRLHEIHPVAWSNAGELLAIAAGLERDSTHPIATAIREGAAERAVAPAAIESVNHVTAQGIEGVHRGSPVRLGRYAFVEPLIPTCLRARVREVLAKIQRQGHVGVVVARAGATEGEGEAAVLIMADSVRPGAERLTPELHALGLRPVRMLTGDNRITAEKVARALALDAWDAELLPEHKLRIVNEMEQSLRGRGGVVAIGDGVNDAPALAGASVSIAMGSIGTAAAMESADIVLVSDNLASIPWAIRFARRVRRTILLNLTLALAIIVGMAVFVVAGSAVGFEIPLAMGVLAHEGGTVLVVLNSLLLLWYAGPPAVGTPDWSVGQDAREKGRARFASPAPTGVP